MNEDNFTFDYEDDDEAYDNETIDLENQYYNSKAMKESNIKESIEGFKKVLQMQGQKGDWGFKALKQLVKCLFKVKKFNESLIYYRQLLEFVRSNAVTKNYSEKSMTHILDTISNTSEATYLNDMYSETLKIAELEKNERLLFKTHLKLAKLYLDQEDIAKLLKEIRVLKNSCLREDGEEDYKKGTQLLEIYALEIQAYTTTKDHVKLKDLYNKSLHVKSAIPHPKILAIIRECGGKMHMRRGEWTKAQVDFFESFKNYDEIGSPHRIQCLKYMVIANLLMMSEINPFDSPETQSYKTHPEIEALTNLVAAYQNNRILEFEEILNQNKNVMLNDPFLKDYIDSLLYQIRSRGLLDYISHHAVEAHASFLYDTIAKHLGLSLSDVESLLISCILEGKVSAMLDQSRQVMELIIQKPEDPELVFIESVKGLHGHIKEIESMIDPLSLSNVQ